MDEKLLFSLFWQRQKTLDWWVTTYEKLLLPVHYLLQVLCIHYTTMVVAILWTENVKKNIWWWLLGKKLLFKPFWQRQKTLEWLEGMQSEGRHSFLLLNVIVIHNNSLTIVDAVLLPNNSETYFLVMFFFNKNTILRNINRQRVSFKLASMQPEWWETQVSSF